MSAIVVPLPKPRAKRLNDILRNTKGGPMRSPRDYNRAALKRKLREELVSK
jgi:hypothetical protein